MGRFHPTPLNGVGLPAPMLNYLGLAFATILLKNPLHNILQSEVRAVLIACLRICDLFLTPLASDFGCELS